MESSQNLAIETSAPQKPSLERRLAIFLHAVFFVLGFSLIFIFGWGGTATIFGQIFSDYKSIIGRVGGLVVILFGLTTLGILKIPWLYMDTRKEWNNKGRRGFAASSLMGMFFAAGWTPCIGTTLGAILTLGFTQETSTQAMLLASGYALGLGIPFLILGWFMDRAALAITRFRRFIRPVQIASGVLMLVLGVMMLTNQMTRIAIWAQQNGYFLDLKFAGADAPTYLIAILAGLISFLSPCVLPLVPAYLGYLSGHAFGPGEKQAN